MNTPNIVQALIVLADGFEEVEAVTPIDFLRRADIHVTVAGLSTPKIRGAHDIVIEAETTLEEALSDVDGPKNLKFDAIILPGGTEGARHLFACDPLIEYITMMLDNGRLVAAICASPVVVLGAHDLLNNRKFTCYPGLEQGIVQDSPSSDRVVIDKNLLTSRGPGTANLFSYEIIRILRGKDAADTIWDQTIQLPHTE